MNQISPKRIGIIAGEASGDILGAGLIRKIKKIIPNVIFEGVAGPRMEKEGCVALFSIEKLACAGFVEPIKRLPELIKIRHQLKKHFLLNKIDLFIGIDSPDFNLGLERKLKEAGIPVVHYVSPSVWAWRQRRIYKIKKSVDLMLTLFPFEADFYQQHHVPVKFVGHPLANEIPLEVDQKAARKKLELDYNKKILAILPGSRKMEIKQMADIFIQTAQRCKKEESDLEIITAMFNEEKAEQFKTILKKVAPDFSVQIFVGNSREVMIAADVLLLAAGTVTLEAMLLKKPMVVAYHMAWLNYFIVKRLVRVNYFSLPNIIANKTLVPEYLQEETTPEILSDTVLKQLNNEKYKRYLKEEFLKLHQLLRKNADVEAAKAVAELLSAHKKIK